ncbi:MAG: MATE family efflux transporter [Anaerorhabdus sp.]
MKIQLSDHFTYKKLLSFVIPSVIMMVVNSVYSIVDGLFVSNIVGTIAFAAINLMMPAIYIIYTIGFMIGTGGSALVGMKLGEKKDQEANELFTLFIVSAIIMGVISSAICFYYMEDIAIYLGANEATLADCILYGRVMMISCTFFILQCCFQNFMITAERPKMGLIVTVIAGVSNVLLDFLLMSVFNFGLLGAAIATALAQTISALIPLFYFLRKNNSRLHFTKFRWDFKSLFKGCSNGASEMLSNLSRSLVGILYNIQLIKIAAENGLAAYGVILYITFIFFAIFLGYSFGVAPIISYNYGSQNKREMKNIFNKSMVLILSTSVLMVFVGIAFSKPLSEIFVGYDKELLQMTIRGLVIYSLSYVFTGFNVFASSFFTALNNGLVSGVLAIVRTMIFEVGAIIILPIYFGLDGIWFAIVVAEALSLIMSVAFIIKGNKNYGYLPSK